MNLRLDMPFFYIFRRLNDQVWHDLFAHSLLENL